MASDESVARKKFVDGALPTAWNWTGPGSGYFLEFLWITEESLLREASRGCGHVLEVATPKFVAYGYFCHPGAWSSVLDPTAIPLRHFFFPGAYTLQSSTPS